jgi:SAM-dependent methyltransferase
MTSGPGGSKFAPRMRTASEFNEHYSKPDPWGSSGAWYRDNALRRPLVDGRSVLELGCGEGHLTETVFCGARPVVGVDISQLAIDRAKARNLPHASFVVADFLDVSLAGFDVIAAIECFYYLADTEQDLFLAKLAREHRGPFILSCPIVGHVQHGRYFTHVGLMARLAAHGIAVGEFHNVSLYRPDGFSRIAAGLFVRLPGSHLALDFLPSRLIYQRLYIGEC